MHVPWHWITVATAALGSATYVACTALPSKVAPTFVACAQETLPFLLKSSLNVARNFHVHMLKRLLGDDLFEQRARTSACGKSSSPQFRHRELLKLVNLHLKPDG